MLFLGDRPVEPSCQSRGCTGTPRDYPASTPLSVAPPPRRLFWKREHTPALRCSPRNRRRIAPVSSKNLPSLYFIVLWPRILATKLPRPATKGGVVVRVRGVVARALRVPRCSAAQRAMRVPRCGAARRARCGVAPACRQAHRCVHTGDSTPLAPSEPSPTRSAKSDIFFKEDGEPRTHAHAHATAHTVARVAEDNATSTFAQVKPSARHRTRPHATARIRTRRSRKSGFRFQTLTR